MFVLWIVGLKSSIAILRQGWLVYSASAKGKVFSKNEAKICWTFLLLRFYRKKIYSCQQLVVYGANFGLLSLNLRFMTLNWRSYILIQIFLFHSVLFLTQFYHVMTKQRQEIRKTVCMMKMLLRSEPFKGTYNEALNILQLIHVSSCKDEKE